MKPIYTLLLVCLSFLSSAQTPTPVEITIAPFITGLTNPLAVRNCGDERLFVCERTTGLIKAYNTNGSLIGTVINLSSVINSGASERGLLGLAFHPDFGSNGYFFVNYTNSSGHTVVRRYTMTPGQSTADPSTAQTIITINQPYTNHNGGDIRFGPDGYLYIFMGDGGSGGDPQNYSQNPNSLLGKILRLDVDGGSPYAIPPGNPYANTPGFADEIWAMGVRNPWRNSFDPVTGDLWIADVGQNNWEEINLQPGTSTGGENYGWRCYEGNAPFNTAGCQPSSFYDFPVAVFPNVSNGFCSITGGEVYRGSAFPGLYGHYLFTDYCEGRIRSLTPNGTGWEVNMLLNQSTFGYVDFGTDQNGELYLSRINNGTVYKISEVCGSFNPQIASGGNGTINASDGVNYFWFLNGQIIPGANQSSYTPSQTGTYSCMIENASGCTRESNSIQWLVAGGIPGCTYANAVNYDSVAEVDDGTCDFIVGADLCPGDLNGDGIINFNDLALFLGLLGTVCP